MKIGITGATGHLGRLVVNKLKEKVKADNIVALVRTPSNAVDMGIEAREFDYDKPEALPGALKDIDTLLLISANEIGKRSRQHTNVVNAAKQAGIKWFLYTSVLHADTTTLSLAGEHRETETAIKSSGIPYTILRNGWYTENYLASADSAIKSGAFIGCAGDGKISSATRADFADAAVAILTSDGHIGKTYELAGDDYYTLSDLAAEISRQSGKNIPYINMTESEYAEKLKSFGLPEDLAKEIASWDASAGRGDLFDESHQLSALIGRKTTPLADAVREALTASK